ncbi:unnamed protein product [Protopolystoma xenopodis]|uniref:Uncharacterized protein n=1 Tax=Protopolystoma xenopodis TaxID=117903 RepID=A0A3S5B080_9PLAT|nr:unnamed protein product [Protopolystoma xenopodis]
MFGLPGTGAGFSPCTLVHTGHRKRHTIASSFRRMVLHGQLVALCTLCQIPVSQASRVSWPTPVLGWPCGSFQSIRSVNPPLATTLCI